MSRVTEAILCTGINSLKVPIYQYELLLRMHSQEMWHWAGICHGTANLPYSRTDLWPPLRIQENSVRRQRERKSHIPHLKDANACWQAQHITFLFLLSLLLLLGSCRKGCQTFLQCDNAGAKRHHEPLGPSHYPHFSLKTSLDPFLNVVIGRQGFSERSGDAPLNRWTY